MKAALIISATAVVVLTSLVLVAAGCSEQSAEQAATSTATNSVLLIEPKVGVGPVHAGMTTGQVVAALGEPERRTSNSLEYTRLGLAIMPGPDGIVSVVMCGDVTGINGPFSKKFTGHTKEGIGMFSTRAQVIQAYGEPTADEPMRGGLESLQYASLGMTLTLEAGKVHHIIIRLRGLQPADRTVTLEPPAEPPGK